MDHDTKVKVQRYVTNARTELVSRVVNIFNKSRVERHVMCIPCKRRMSEKDYKDEMRPLGIVQVCRIRLSPTRETANTFYVPLIPPCLEPFGGGLQGRTGRGGGWSDCTRRCCRCCCCGSGHNGRRGHEIKQEFQHGYVSTIQKEEIIRNVDTGQERKPTIQ